MSKLNKLWEKFDATKKELNKLEFNSQAYNEKKFKLLEIYSAIEAEERAMLTWQVAATA